ncbi:MAG: hypothetical protein JOY71_08375 [Acetobacteraceae bacterium]|nr:hypothetical protein [Acetobacteraceae bacterium]MBV8522127.1 hypothetical protein [Acetobacteraceae bacterium]
MKKTIIAFTLAATATLAACTNPYNPGQRAAGGRSLVAPEALELEHYLVAARALP